MKDIFLVLIKSTTSKVLGRDDLRLLNVLDSSDKKEMLGYRRHRNALYESPWLALSVLGHEYHLE